MIGLVLNLGHVHGPITLFVDDYLGSVVSTIHCYVTISAGKGCEIARRYFLLV